MSKLCLFFCFVEIATKSSRGKVFAFPPSSPSSSFRMLQGAAKYHDGPPLRTSTSTTTTTTTTPMVQNPNTKRSIQLGGPTYNGLLQQGGWVQHEGTLKRLDFEALRQYQQLQSDRQADDDKQTFQYNNKEESNSHGDEQIQEEWYCITPSVVVLDDDDDEEEVSSSSTSQQQRRRRIRRRSLSPDELQLLQEELLFVYKPSGLNCVPSRDLSSDSLASKISFLYGKMAKPCHRLDRDTSGIVLFGLTPTAHRDCSKQFELRTTQKSYMALISGHPTTTANNPTTKENDDPPTPPAKATSSYHHPGQIIDLPIGKVKTEEGFHRWTIGGDKPRQAITEWRIEETVTIEGAMFSKVHLEPKTGRGHQLRLHMKAMGCPILGDTLHGEDGVAACSPRLCLHAQTLQVDWNGLRLEAESVTPF